MDTPLQSYSLEISRPQTPLRELKKFQKLRLLDLSTHPYKIEKWTYRMIQSNMSKARVRDETCSLQYILRHAYIAAKPPIKLRFPKSNTAAFPIYARLPKCRYRKGPKTASSVEGMSLATRISCCLASLESFFPRYFPCCEATCAVYRRKFFRK